MYKYLHLAECQLLIKLHCITEITSSASNSEHVEHTSVKYMFAYANETKTKLTNCFMEISTFLKCGKYYPSANVQIQILAERKFLINMICISEIKSSVNTSEQVTHANVKNMFIVLMRLRTTPKFILFMIEIFKIIEW